MRKNPRVVFDTNVLVSAVLIKSSTSRQAFETAILFGEVLVSLATLAELSEVLSREKFACYVTEAERLQFLTKFTSIANPVEVDANIKACRDPKDNKFLELP